MDKQEEKDLANQHPKVLNQMQPRLQKIIAAGRSRPVN